MSGPVAFLQAHGLPALFLVVLADQLGLPLPSLPLLLAAGALMGLGYLGPVPGLLVILAATLLGDLLWYELGRRRGPQVLNLLCRVSLEPESCVRLTEGVFSRHGERVLLFAKFVPGLYTVTPPVAGLVGIPRWRFLALDALGALLWAGTYLGLGAALSAQLEELLQALEGLGATLLQIIFGILVVHVAWKLVWRWRFLRKLRTARISPQQLKELLDEGQQPLVADLRQRLDMERDPFVIPGAVVLSVEDLEARHQELPRDRDIILYCS